MGIKASGGIKKLGDALGLIYAGATRIGHHIILYIKG